MVIIFAGHGAGPVAALMVLGSLSAWGSSQLPGWLGVLVSLAAVFARSDAAYLAMRFWGVFLLGLSVGVFISHGEAILISVVTALPLLGLGGLFLSGYLASWRREPGRPDRPRQVTWAVAALGMSLATEAVFLLPALWPESLVRETVIEALQPTVLSLVTGFLLLLDIAIVSLLLTSAASSWLRGRARAAHAP